MAELNIDKISLFAEPGKVSANLYVASGGFRSCVVVDKTVIKALHTALVTIAHNDSYQIVATTDESTSPFVLTELRIDN